MKLVKTEPALFVGLVQTALALLVSTGLHLTAAQAGSIEAAAAAALGLVVAASTRPFQVAALTGLISALGTLVTTFGLHHVTPGQVSAVNAFVVAILALILRSHLTPKASAVKM